MNQADTYRDAFLRFLADGMSCAEAYEQFDEGQLRSAITAQFESGLVHKFGSDTLFDLVVKANFEIRNQKDFEEHAVPLMGAGWTMENPSPTNSKDMWRQTQWMSLYWRAPSRRKGKPGRRYLSTNQAFNAMMKATAQPASPDQ